MEDGAGSGPLHHVRHHNEAPGFLFQTRPAAAVAAIWGVNKQMEDLCLSVCFSLSWKGVVGESGMRERDE